MSVPSHLRAYLLAGGGLAALVGSRVYPDALPQAVDLPAVVYYVVSTTHKPSLGGIVEIDRVTIQLDSYASTRAGADALSAAIEARMKTLSAAPGTAIGQIEGSGGSVVSDVEVSGPRDDRQPPADGSDDWQYISSVDVTLSLG